MTRTLHALWAIAMLAALGLSTTSASAYVADQGQWLSGLGQREVVSSPRAGRSATRRARAGRVAVDTDLDDVRPQTTRRTRAGRATLPNLSGGLGSGIASYYWQPQRVASGGWFNPNAMTAAHKTLPFGTRVRVTNLSNGRSVTVTINDRGPYIRGRVIDLSRAAASAVGMTGAGLARVNMTVVGRG